MPLIIDQIPVKHSKTSGKVFSHRKRRIFFPHAKNTEKESGGKGAVRAKNGCTVSSASKIVL